MANLGNWQK